MRITLVILIGIHSFIHLFGFLKAFDFLNFNAINQPISKTFGVIWLLTFLLFIFTITQYFTHSKYWWAYALFSLIISQVLIFNSWSDTKFGTIINVIILILTISAYANYHFKDEVKGEIKRLFDQSKTTNQKIILKDDIANLPPVIQKWLINSGIIGKPKTINLYLTQDLKLKLKPEQKEWNKGTAKQYFTITPPAFNWSIHSQMNPFLSVIGRDKFVDGKGEMKIKLLSIIPVANAKSDVKTNQATLQRYLAEIVWFPSASLNSCIKWKALNKSSVLAIMEYKGTKGSGVFHFDKEGNFKKFIAMRYRDSNKIVPEEWTITATKTEKRNGIKIPTECEASWKLEDKKWTWLKLKITDIRYNLKEMPLD